MAVGVQLPQCTLVLWLNFQVSQNMVGSTIDHYEQGGTHALAGIPWVILELYIYRVYHLEYGGAIRSQQLEDRLFPSAVFQYLRTFNLFISNTFKLSNTFWATVIALMLSNWLFYYTKNFLLNRNRIKRICLRHHPFLLLLYVKNTFARRRTRCCSTACHWRHNWYPGNKTQNMHIKKAMGILLTPPSVRPSVTLSPPNPLAGILPNLLNHFPSW